MEQATSPGADPGIFVGGGGHESSGINRPAKLIFQIYLYNIDLITFRHTKPGHLNCSYSGVSEKWSAIFVRCTVPEIYLYF